MKRTRKKVPGSLFKRFFIMISVSVLLSIAASSIILLFLYINLWNQERLVSLSDDALSLAQSVDLLYNVSDEFDGEYSYSEENEGVLLAVTSALSSSAVTSNEEVFIVSEGGNIELCRDIADFDNGSISLDKVCPLHYGKHINKEIVSQVENNKGRVFSYEGELNEFGEQEYFLAAVKLESSVSSPHYVYVIQSKGDAYLPYTTNYMRIIMIAELFAVLVSFIASLIVSYKMSKPIKRITEATKHYAGGDFSVRIDKTDDFQELQELVRSVNSMADNLAVLEESRSNFVANVSHELKTPMTIIGGFIDGILDGTIAEEERDKYLGIVSEEVKRLSGLVVAMLNMSKIQAGKLTLNYSPINIYNIVCKILISFESVIEEKNINITGLDISEKVIINADDDLINQIFYNLIDNAVKFTPENGEISIFVKQEKKIATVIIRNTGRGLTEEECSQVFDRFYKADRSRGLDAKSFGLGLFIVKSVIELHSGSISVNSEPNKYTEFEIKLPV